MIRRTTGFASHDDRCSMQFNARRNTHHSTSQPTEPHYQPKTDKSTNNKTIMI